MVGFVVHSIYSIYIYISVADIVHSLVSICSISIGNVTVVCATADSDDVKSVKHFCRSLSDFVFVCVFYFMFCLIVYAKL